MSTDREPQAVLGLPSDATRAEAQRAFRRLAKQTHPDLGGNAAAFRAVAGAWADLAPTLPTGPAGAPAPDDVAVPVTDRRRPPSGAALLYRSVAAATEPASRVIWAEPRPAVRRRPVRNDFATALAAEMARQAA